MGAGGFHRRTTGVGARLGAKGIGATLYELPAGERTRPYHYEYGNEEWLLVLFIFPGNNEDKLMVPRGASADYWDGKLPPADAD